MVLEDQSGYGTNMHIHFNIFRLHIHMRHKFNIYVIYINYFGPTQATTQKQSPSHSLLIFDGKCYVSRL